MRSFRALCAIAFAALLLPSAFSRGQAREQVERYRSGAEAEMRPIVRLPILGGSVPLSTLQDALGRPVVIVPIVNHDNNQHAANENLRLRNLWDGMVVFSALFTGLAGAWP